MKQLITFLSLIIGSYNCFSQYTSELHPLYFKYNGHTWDLLASVYINDSGGAGPIYREKDSANWHLPEIKDSGAVIRRLLSIIETNMQNNQKEMAEKDKIIYRFEALHKSAQECLLHLPDYFDKKSVAIFDKYLNYYRKLLKQK